MKKYYVIKFFDAINSTSIVANFDCKEDAIAYAEMAKKGTGLDHFVVEGIFSTED